MLGLLGVAIERFVYLHHHFGSFMQENCTNINETAGAGEMVAPYGSDLTRETRDQLDFDDSFETTDHEPTSCDKSCDHWTCTNDFIYALALVVNVCELIKD